MVPWSLFRETSFPVLSLHSSHIWLPWYVYFILIQSRCLPHNQQLGRTRHSYTKQHPQVPLHFHKHVNTITFLFAFPGLLHLPNFIAS